VSAKLTPEICINNASSNQQVDSTRQACHNHRYHSQNCLSRHFFFSLSLPLMRKQLNYTCMLKNLRKLYCIWSWDTLWVFFCFFVFVQFCSILCVPIDKTTTEQHLWHHLQDWRLRQTPKLLRLKLHFIWTWRFLFFIFYFSFCFILFIYILHSFVYFYFYSCLYSFYFLFSILSLSL
jgi:hypothetical protein